MNKKEIIAELKRAEKFNSKFERDKTKFIEKYPKAGIYNYFYLDIDGTVFKKRYELENFYRPTRIVLEKGKISMEMEKWSLNSWSCGSLNKVTLDKFILDFTEVSENFVIEYCNKKKEAFLRSIKKLSKDTLARLNNG